MYSQENSWMIPVQQYKSSSHIATLGHAFQTFANRSPLLVNAIIICKSLKNLRLRFWDLKKHPTRWKLCKPSLQVLFQPQELEVSLNGESLSLLGNVFGLFWDLGKGSERLQNLEGIYSHPIDRLGIYRWSLSDRSRWVAVLVCSSRTEQEFNSTFKALTKFMAGQELSWVTALFWLYSIHYLCKS